MTRGITVVTTLRDIIAAKNPQKFAELLPEAIVLGWCIEIV